jgi:hypothetical protein
MMKTGLGLNGSGWRGRRASTSLNFDMTRWTCFSIVMHRLGTHWDSRWSVVLLSTSHFKILSSYACYCASEGDLDGSWLSDKRRKR